MVIDDNFYMELAISEAWKYQLLTYPNPAVGCVVVKKGQILAVEAHHEAGKPHAEVNALLAAFMKHSQPDLPPDCIESSAIHDFLLSCHNGFFNDCDIYVTLEPCNHYGKTPPCAQLLSILKPRRVIISVLDPNLVASGGVSRLLEAGIEVVCGVLEDDGKNLLYPFIVSNAGGIRLFKIAQRLNGSIDGGYISSPFMLQFVHQIRTKIDLLCIGGNTVRCDRPTLDSRFAPHNRAPNVYIFSHLSKNDFDLTIPLFHVSGRDVNVGNDLQVLTQSKFVLIEGGQNLLKIAYNHSNLFLVIVSLQYSSFQQIICADVDFVHLRTVVVANELMIWFKKREMKCHQQ